MTYDKSWEKFITHSKYLDDKIEFVNNTDNICPTRDKVFRFLNCDLSKAKCIILGMDPYPSTFISNGKEIPVATGRAFEVANVEKFTDKYKQVSLSNIFKALVYYKLDKVYSTAELRKLENTFKYANVKNWFDAMEKQGVIFLNVTLTTLVGKSGSHIKIWTSFMDELIKYIVENTNCKWLIWGNVALDRVKGLVPDTNIIYSCHPAARANNDFVINTPFSKVKGIEWF